MKTISSYGAVVASRKPGLRSAAKPAPTLLLPAVLSLGAVLLAGTAAFAGDVSLDNLKIEDKGQVATIAHVDVTDTNLSKDEVAKLFQPGTKPEEAADILRRMKAAKVSIPEIVSKDHDFVVTVRNLVATDINEGKVGKLAIDGVSGTNAPGAKLASMSVGPAFVENADLSRLLDAARNKADVEPTALGQAVGHMLIKDIDATTEATSPDDKPVGVNHIHVAAVEGIGDRAALPKERGTFEIRNVLFEPAKGSSEAATLGQLGYDKLDMGLKIAGSYDPTTKKLSIEDVTISGVDMGALGLKAELSNYAKPTEKSPDASQKAMLNAELNSVQLSFVNAGLFQNALKIVAKQQGKSPDAVKAEWGAIATAMLPAILGGDPAGTAIGGAVQQFVNNPKSITIAATAKGAPVRIGDLKEAQSPQDVLSKINVTASANK